MSTIYVDHLINCDFTYLPMILILYMLMRLSPSTKLKDLHEISGWFKSYIWTLYGHRYQHSRQSSLRCLHQLVRYARICTSKVDFMNRLHGLSLRLRQQGFETNLLQKSFNKFFNRHGLIVVKYGATLREMRLAIQAWIAPSYLYITYLLLRLFFQLYHSTCGRAILFCACALFINSIGVCI